MKFPLKFLTCLSLIYTSGVSHSGSVYAIDFSQIKHLKTVEEFNRALPRSDLRTLLEKIKNGQNVIFTKFGDGENFCMSGATGANCDGDSYNPWLSKALRKSLSELTLKKNVFLGLWGTPFPYDPNNNIYRYFESLLVDIHGHTQLPAEFVCYNLMINDDEFYRHPYMHEFVEFLQKTDRKKILICNQNNASLSSFLKVDHLITLPGKNWSLNYELYKQKLLDQIEKDAIVIIGGGMCSKVLINDITNTHEVTFLDIGCSFDFLSTKKRSRAFNHSLDVELDYYRDLIPKAYE
jgi:hypothetical protein